MVTKARLTSVAPRVSPRKVRYCMAPEFWRCQLEWKATDPAVMRKRRVKISQIDWFTSASMRPRLLRALPEQRAILVEGPVKTATPTTKEVTLSSLPRGAKRLVPTASTTCPSSPKRAAVTSSPPTSTWVGSGLSPAAARSATHPLAAALAGPLTGPAGAAPGVASVVHLPGSIETGPVAVVTVDQGTSTAVERSIDLGGMVPSGQT